MVELFAFIQGTLADWWDRGVPDAVLVAAVLAVAGFFLPKGLYRLTGMGRRAVLRTLVLSCLLLVLLGALASVLLYAISGVQLHAAWVSDPLGGTAYFLATGAQLAAPGVVVAVLRSLTLAGQGAASPTG
ncbi:hypothetical protein [Oceaniglobus roseus]|uniref:hypothetical protein n=1 Tax=Oceaniglobus roseus TaxID=1737570 RepID=UPI000C7EC4CB|nr:hypothetical protein [Kandeliimicrobium roseum]